MYRRVRGEATANNRWPVRPSECWRESGLIPIASHGVFGSGIRMIFMKITSADQTRDAART